MKLLVDANLSPVVSEQLKAAGIDASHVYDHDLGTASDEAIAAFAEEVGAAVISADSDVDRWRSISARRARRHVAGQERARCQAPARPRRTTLNADLAYRVDHRIDVCDPPRLGGVPALELRSAVDPPVKIRSDGVPTMRHTSLVGRSWPTRRAESVTPGRRARSLREAANVPTVRGSTTTGSCR